MTIDTFKAQDIFTERMLKEYNHMDVLKKAVYKPYFDWKKGETNTISRQDAYAIKDAASDDLWDMYQKYPDAPGKATNLPLWGAYEGYGDDKYLVSFLEYIDDEIVFFIA